MQKIKPIKTPQPLAVEANKRMDAVRAKFPDNPLPTLVELRDRYGPDWLTYDSAVNKKYLAPWPCSKCGSHEARIGNGTCTSCYGDIVVLIRPRKKEAQPDDAVSP